MEKNLKSKSIGIFDSGLGGLTVAKEIIRVLPNENIIYLGDTARVPYGVKSPDTVIKYAFQNTRFLINKNVKVVVIACNTASAFSLNKLKLAMPLPCLGVIEPGAEAAINQTRSGQIGVIGTSGTITSRAYEKAILSKDEKMKVVSKACPLFVPLVEEAWIDHEITYKVAEIYLNEFRDQKIDTLILGCTHYPLLKRVISSVLRERVILVDSAVTLAEELKRLLQNMDLLNEQRQEGQYQFFVTDMPKQFYDLGKLFLQREIFPVEHVDISDFNT